MSKTVFGGVIQAGGLSRVLQHLNNKFGVVSAYRDENPEAVNQKLHAQLKKDVRNLGYGFIELNSAWEENGEVSREQALFIPNIKRLDIIDLGAKYKQYAVLHGDKGVTELICTNAQYCGGVGKILNVFTKTHISEDDFKGAFSQLKKGNGNARNKKFQLSKVQERHRPHGLPIGRFNG